MSRITEMKKMLTTPRLSEFYNQQLEDKYIYYYFNKDEYLNAFDGCEDPDLWKKQITNIYNESIEQYVLNTPEEEFLIAEDERDCRYYLGDEAVDLLLNSSKWLEEDWNKEQ